MCLFYQAFNFEVINKPIKPHSVQAHIYIGFNLLLYFDMVFTMKIIMDADLTLKYKNLFPFCRDIQTVLREDREKLRQMQKSQPRFTEEQRRELLEVHPWMRRGGLPKAFDVKVCIH